MKRLYDKDDRYTNKALDLDDETIKATRPIIIKWYDAGFSIRDIQNVMTTAIYDTILEKLIPDEELEEET